MDDVALYARLNLTDCDQDPGVSVSGPLETEVCRILQEYTHRHPAAPFSLVNLAVALAEEGVQGTGEPRPCEDCQEQRATSCPARRIPGQVPGHG